MGLVVLAGDGGDFDLLEAGFLQGPVERAFFETEPEVAVEFAHFLEVVPLQVEDKELNEQLARKLA